MATQHAYQCDLCDRRFKREDHLQRHKLSHGKARFQCPHSKCGMTFHRKDVLQRHMKVHEPDPAVKRRRPRRGIEPKPFVRNASPSEDRSNSNTTDWDSTAHPVRSASDTVADGLQLKIEEDPLAHLPQDALDFCSLHFQQACMKRFNFIHKTSLDRNTMLPEKLLAMAAVGAVAIPEYKTASVSFSKRAQLLVERRREVDPLTQKPACADTKAFLWSDEDLDLLQAQVLLIEFASWSATIDDRKWANACVIYLATHVIPRVVSHLKSLGPMRECTWASWTHREQNVRTLWAFYCTSQKARILMACSFSTLEMQRDLPLPGPDSIFDAADEMNWGRRIEVTMVGTSRPLPTFNDALYALMSSNRKDECVLEHVTTLGRQILLSALLDLFHSTRLLPSNFESNSSYSSCNLAHFKPRAQYTQALRTWRKLWWVGTSQLFRSRPVRSADMQNVLFLNYLELIILEAQDYKQTKREGNKTVISVMCDILSAFTADGVYEVAVQSPWLFDGATRHFTAEFARSMLRWIRRIQRQPDDSPSTTISFHQANPVFSLSPHSTPSSLTIPSVTVTPASNTHSDHPLSQLDPEDYAAYVRCCDALRVFAKECPHLPDDGEGLDLELASLGGVERLLVEAWSTILCTREWIDDVP